MISLCEINNRPKKVLVFNIPFKALQKELITGVAFPSRM